MQKKKGEALKAIYNCIIKGRDKHFQVNSCHAILVGDDTDVKMNDRLTGLLFYEMTADK